MGGDLLQSHPEAQTFLDLAAGKLDGEEKVKAEIHIRDCKECQQFYDEAVRIETLIAEMYKSIQLLKDEINRR